MESVVNGRFIERVLEIKADTNAIVGNDKKPLDI